MPQKPTARWVFVLPVASLVLAELFYYVILYEVTELLLSVAGDRTHIGTYVGV